MLVNHTSIGDQWFNGVEINEINLMTMNWKMLQKWKQE
jgi:hypothetical protein